MGLVVGDWTFNVPLNGLTVLSAFLNCLENSASFGPMASLLSFFPFFQLLSNIASRMTLWWPGMGGGLYMTSSISLVVFVPIWFFWSSIPVFSVGIFSLRYLLLTSKCDPNSFSSSLLVSMLGMWLPRGDLIFQWSFAGRYAHVSNRVGQK